MLAAVLARIIPADQDPGAIELGVPAYFEERLSVDTRLASETTSLLSQLPSDFAAKSPENQDLLLGAFDLIYISQIAWEGALANNLEGMKMVGFFERV